MHHASVYLLILSNYPLFDYLQLVRRVGATHTAHTTHGTRAAHGTAHGRRVIIRATHRGTVAKVLLAQSCKTLLLGGRIDVGADNKADHVEEGNPEGVGEELLGKGQGNR